MWLVLVGEGSRGFILHIDLKNLNYYLLIFMLVYNTSNFIRFISHPE